METGGFPTKAPCAEACISTFRAWRTWTRVRREVHITVQWLTLPWKPPNTRLAWFRIIDIDSASHFSDIGEGDEARAPTTCEGGAIHAAGDTDMATDARPGFDGAVMFEGTTAVCCGGRQTTAPPLLPTRRLLTPTPRLEKAAQ